MNAIEIKSLTKTYGDFTLDNLNLILPQGTIMGLIGENGAGKSTTIKLILDMIKRDGGTVTLLGKDNKDNLRLTKEEIGVVLDDVGISECLTTAQVGKIMKLTYSNWNQETYESYLNFFSLPRKKKFKEFSRGMKMKLGIAVALSHNPKLLILDEATSGLDPVIRDEILDIFCEFTRDETHSILISSHIVSDLEKICDFVAFLHKGKLLLCEEKDALKDQYAIVRCSIEQLSNFEASAIISTKKNAYGFEVLMQRDKVPGNIEKSSVDIEQLFLFMVKEVDAK
ncbi:MAG: ABC transporter ATP-binding protein [Butyribacter sp.]|nr:ABC transporter ATP-binding protein [bacterium]MDY3855095.1 ABC transporter ATP-binding protein [Butyribacter sp.]